MEVFENLFENISNFFTSITKWIENFITSIFGSSNERMLKKLQSRVDAINALEPKYQGMSNEELKEQTVKFRERINAGETVDDILNEAFAVCRETSSRVLGLRHYDVQLIGGMVLHFGNIAEMMTGEGKTLVATLPAYLNALDGKGVHVVTVNDYLARRDREWMGPLYQALGLTTGLIQSNMPTEDRQAAYACDITYGTNNEFGFDYLRDNMRFAKRGDERFPLSSQQSQGRLHFAIVDEVDNILIDEARTPLIIAGPAHDDVSKYKAADVIARQLIKEVDFKVDEKDHTTNLTDEGVIHAEHLAGVESFYTVGNMHWPHLIDNALKAHHLYKRDTNYVIKNGEVIIVDEFTGRLMEGRSWSDGLHQAVEAKENVRVKEENQTLATITLQNFFKLYDKLSGMTGTAMTEAGEFWKIYKLEVIAIPPNKKVKRINHADLIYKTETEKYNAVVDEIERIHKWDTIVVKGEEYLGTIAKEDESQLEFIPKGEKNAQSIPRSNIEEIEYKGRPILVGTVSIQKSEVISAMLNRKGIKHQVLNARPENIGRESEIIAQAGRLSTVTIATNMAGRGTDIILGGNPETLAWSILQTKYPTRLDVPSDEWNALVEEIEQREKMKQEGERVRQLGGLYVVGTERHEARRIDLQLCGRCGRQGDPGDARFFLSLEDDLVRIFAGDWVKNILTRIGMEDGQAIESRMVTRRIEGAQKKIEERNFDTRKSLLEYDEVMDMQRKRVYTYRQQILDGGNTQDMIRKMIESQVQTHLNDYLDPNYGAASFASKASKRFGVEFEMKQFRGLDAKSAQEYAIDHATRMAETQVLDAVEENLSKDVPEQEWNWQALTKTANMRWRTNFRDSDLKKIGREDVAEFLIEKAEKFVKGVDLSSDLPALDAQYGIRSACDWIRGKFAIELNPDQYKNTDVQPFIDQVMQFVLDKYHEKEVRFPVMAGLIHFTVHDQNGKHYDRDNIVDWAERRFNATLSNDALKNKQRQEIEELLFDVSQKSAQEARKHYETLLQKLNSIFQNQHIDIDKIQAIRDFRIARNERISVDDLIKLNKKDVQLSELCQWLNTNFDKELTPNEIADWDVLYVRDRLESIIEDRYNPEMRKVERSLILGILDSAWKEHLLVMDHLKSSVSFRGYAQVDPKIEYKREGMRVFEMMWNGIFERVTDYIYRVEQLDENFIGSTWTETEASHESVSSTAVVDDIKQQQEAAIDASKDHKIVTIRNKVERVGRNDPCPCGSGKKYKKCHGLNK